MSEIPPIKIPEDALCQEASIHSVSSYIPCGNKATCIIYHERDHRGYYMCDSCGAHNIDNRGGKIVAKSPESHLQ